MHFKEVCSCGKVLRQCRCPGPKTVTTSIEACTHVEPQKNESIDTVGQLIKALSAFPSEAQVGVRYEGGGSGPVVEVSLHPITNTVEVETW